MLGAYLNAHPLDTMMTAMPVCPFPAMEARDAWAVLPQADRDDLLALHAQYQHTPYPMCTASQFMAFVRSGSRKAYEDPYFFRRRKLIAAVMHMCLTGTQDALDDVIDGVWCICEESSWVISAHNVNPFPGAPRAADKPLPDMRDRYVDLFAAQTAMILSLTAHLVGKSLDAAAPIVRERIALEIENRIFTPFMTRDDFWWMGFIRKDLCNWTPWIVSNILLAASLQLHDPLRFARLGDRACRMLDRWLAVMPDDGGCDEGTAYYNMAGGALFDCLELLERATGGQMALWGEEKIRNILAFPLATELEGGWFVNFADCDARPFLCGERLQAAGEKLGHPALIALGAAHRDTPSRQIADVPHFSRLLARLFHPAPTAASRASAPRDVWLPDLQLRVVEKDGMILCAKGGHNGESHNHNDVGSFTLFWGGEPQIVDMGNATYTAKTFSDARYTLFHIRSASHNLPVIGGHEQQPGDAFRARDVQRTDGGLTLDIAGAYGEEAGVTRCRRELTLGSALQLHDAISLTAPQPVIWTFMLRHAPRALPDGSILSGPIRIRASEPLACHIEELPITDARMARCFPGSLWHLRAESSARANHDVTFTIERAESHESGQE